MTEPRKRKLGNPISATLTALRDISDKTGLIDPSPYTDDMLGKTCLVTGANTGLGFAIATELARRGARLILAGRSGIPETADKISANTGNENIEMEQVDLADLKSVDALVSRLAGRKVTLDRLILNAGLMAQKSQKSAQGFELMFAVHFLANQRLATQLVDKGVIPRGADARIIAVSSEAHRTSPPLDMATFGVYQSHGIGGSMKQYGHSKLALSLMVRELAKQLAGTNGSPEISVFHMCPGPINSSIARDAPALMRPLINGVMGMFFPSPAKAAEPAIYLACSPSLNGRTGEYMHLMRFKPPSEDAQNDAHARAVFAFGETQFKSL